MQGKQYVQCLFRRLQQLSESQCYFDAGVVVCELERVPLPLYWLKMLLKYVSRISKLPSDRLVKRALFMPLL